MLFEIKFFHVFMVLFLFLTEIVIECENPNLLSVLGFRIYVNDIETSTTVKIF